MNDKNTLVFNGRQSGRTTVFDKHFREHIIPTMKEGQTIGIPVAGGIAIFRFEGIVKPKPAVMEFKDTDVDMTFKYANQYDKGDK